MTSKEESLAAFASETLVAEQSFSFVEGWTDIDGHLRVRRGRISFAELPAFLKGIHNAKEEEEKERRAYRFRVLSVPRLENGRLKIGLPKETFGLVRRTWHLHALTLEALLNNNGILSTFDTQGTRSIVLKVAAARSIGFDGVSVAHNRALRCTYVLYHSLADEAGIFDALATNSTRCLHPGFFALVVYRCHQQRLERFRNALDDELVAIERGTKLGGSGRLFGHRYRHEEAPLAKKIEVESETQRLSYVQTELAVGSHVARSSLKMGEWLVQLAAEEHEESKMAGGDEIDMDARQQTLDEAEYVRRRAETVVSQLQQVGDRARSQTTFLLNTATQTSTHLNASIALETRRDSSAMKTIAVMTIIFLPGTFVATLFSMDMFSWGDNSGGTPAPAVSSFFWIYWLVSVPLTLIVVGTWIWWTRRELGQWARVKSWKDLE